jgi:hypothetical protein
MTKQMIDGSAGPARKDIGTLLIASLFIGLGLVTLYDVTTYSDTDSVVFPTFVAYALIFCSVLVILYSWLRPSPDNGFGSGNWWRRLLLVATMHDRCLSGDALCSGFLTGNSRLPFAGSLIAARHEGWDMPVAGLCSQPPASVIMAGFYALFRFALGVPLP